MVIGRRLVGGGHDTVFDPCHTWYDERTGCLGTTSSAIAFDAVTHSGTVAPMYVVVCGSRNVSTYIDLPRKGFERERGSSVVHLALTPRLSGTL